MRAQLPDDHPFFSPAYGNRYDPLLVTETFRQAGLLVLHASYGVPIDHRLLLSDMSYNCRMDRLTAEPGGSEMEVEVRFRDLQRRAGHIAYVSVEFTLRRDGLEAATGRINSRLISGPVYHRLRNGRTTAGFSEPTRPPVAPSLVGRSHGGDVLLADTEKGNAWELRVDTGHPTLFQRPNDHVPGMLLFEAGRQATRAAYAPAPFVPASGDIAFHRYVEFDEPCVIQGYPMMNAAGDPSVRIIGSQDGEFACVANFSSSGSA